MNDGSEFLREWGRAGGEEVVRLHVCNAGRLSLEAVVLIRQPTGGPIWVFGSLRLRNVDGESYDPGWVKISACPFCGDNLDGYEALSRSACR
jgi:hypothetical protein